MFSSADGARAGSRPCAWAAPMRPLRSAQAETSLVRRSASQSDAARGRAGEAPRVGPYFEYAASLPTTRSLRRGGGLLGSPRSGAPRGALPGPRRRGRPWRYAIALGGSGLGAGRQLLRHLLVGGVEELRPAAVARHVDDFDVLVEDARDLRALGREEEQARPARGLQVV